MTRYQQSVYSFDMLHARRIALAGGPWAGKSTLARVLRKEYGFFAIDTSRQLKELASTALAAVGRTVSAYDMEEDKQRYRAFLEEFGTVLGIDDGWSFLRCFYDPVESQLGTQCVVVDSVRTNSQAATLAAYGFVTIELLLTADIRRERARSFGVSSEDFERTMSHAVEQPLSRDVVGIHLPGTLPVETLGGIIAELMGLA